MFRKFSADQLFTGYTMLGPDAVLITDQNGIVEDITDYANAGSDVEKLTGIISPGFINCHCHLELSHLHGAVPKNTGMAKFLLSILGGRSAAEETVLSAMRTAENYMQEHGIVAVGDICNTADSVVVKACSNLLYHNFIEVTGFTESRSQQRFDQGVQVYEKFIAGGLDRVSIVPHSPYSVSDNLFKLINAYSKGSVLTIHNQESVAETEFFTTGKGDLLELYSALGIDITDFQTSQDSSLIRSIIKITGDHSLILVHNVNTTADDLDAIRRGRNLPQLYWCLCPNANLYITGQLPDVTLLRNFNSKIVIGTDSLASNGQLNVLEELKTIQKNFTDLTTPELLKWATINGAEAMRIEEQYGSFENGKLPGVVNIRLANSDSLEGSMSKRIL